MHRLELEDVGGRSVGMRDPVRLSPSTPGKVSGNQWYEFQMDLEADSEARMVEVEWPENLDWEGDYSENQSFAEVLDRVMFLDGGDGEWRRLERVERIPNGVRVVVPPGSSGRRMAVGMPVGMDDLNRVLSLASAYPRTRVERLGTALRGTPIHAVTLEGRPDAAGTLVVSAGLHFSEWAGLRMIEAMLRFLLGKEGEEARKRYRWILYPWINTDALALGWRGDPLHVDGINLNRDWGPFERPETRCVRDHLERELGAGSPPLHLLDLHMGWHSRDTCGAGMTVPKDGDAPANLIERQLEFVRRVMKRVDYTDFIWRHGSMDRPNFASWFARRFGCPAQTVEVSRHRWRRRSDGRWVSPSMELERELGRELARSLADFHSGAQGGNR